MSDITMCMNATCKFRESCYRYTAKPSEYQQSYDKFEPESDGCDYYMADYRAAAAMSEGQE